jgi:hypothetical protein
MITHMIDCYKHKHKCEVREEQLHHYIISNVGNVKFANEEFREVVV